jgi:hypothetical protein
MQLFEPRTEPRRSAQTPHVAMAETLSTYCSPARLLDETPAAKPAAGHHHHLESSSSGKDSVNDGALNDWSGTYD